MKQIKNGIANLLPIVFDDGLLVSDGIPLVITDGQCNYVQVTQTGATIFVENLVSEDFIIFYNGVSAKAIIVEVISQTANAIATLKLDEQP